MQSIYIQRKSEKLINKLVIKLVIKLAFEKAKTMNNLQATKPFAAGSF